MARVIPPAFSAESIEMICRALGDAVTGPQISNLILPLKIEEPISERQNTKWKRLFNVVVQRQNRQGDGRPLVALILSVMNPVRFENQLEFDRHRAAVNERLLLSGLEVGQDGGVGTVKNRPSTIEEARRRADQLRAELSRRSVHPDVLHFCRAELLQKNYFHAVLEAWKSVAEKLRRLSGLTGDGAALVDQACALTAGTPKVSLGDLSTEWGQSEHKGTAMLMKGIFSTFRNPVAHAPRVSWATSQTDALDMLTLASMLHRRLDSATTNRT